ncbi:probable basic-leucine zipper transcription factor R [Maniola jurtina]|uniref:probable basic-leucine zipper transcription factor R n=1 Tax=Maniola jurtina TaxID=191418 RepID=UPI001E68DEEE|nr:probable basic-leucine zipper transcription factor R [Maniola jurtina]
MKTIFLLLALALCARSEDANKTSQPVETQNKDKRQTEEGTQQLVYRTARKQDQVAPVEENHQEDDKGQRGGSEEYRPGQVYSLNVQELLELQPERKAPLGSSQQLQQLYTNPQQEHRQNLQQFYYLEPQLSRQFALQPSSHTVIARPHYSSNGGEASVGAALSVSDTASSSESLDQELLALLRQQIRQEDTRPQTFTQTQQPQLQAQTVASQYQPVDVPYISKPLKKPLKLRSKVQTASTPTSAPQQYLIETTNVQQQQHQFRPIPQNQRVPQTLRYIPIQSAQAAVQQPLYERPESQGLKVVPAPQLQQLNPQYNNYRIQYQQEAAPKQYRIIDTPRAQSVRQEQARVLSNERPVTYLKRYQEPEKLRIVPTEQSIHEGLSSVQRPVQIADYYLRPVYRSNEQRARYDLPSATLRPVEQGRSFDTVKTPLSSIYVSKNIAPKKVARPVVRYEQVPKIEQPYRIEQASTDQVNVEQHTQNIAEQRSHLPPPRNNKAYTPEEFAALVAAGYSVTPVPVTQEGTQVAQSRSSSEPITVQQRRLYSRRHQYLPLRGDDAP